MYTSSQCDDSTNRFIVYANSDNCKKNVLTKKAGHLHIISAMPKTLVAGFDHICCLFCHHVDGADNVATDVIRKDTGVHNAQTRDSLHL